MTTQFSDKANWFSTEPWFDIPSHAELDRVCEADRIARNQSRRQFAKWRFYQDAFDFIQDNNIGGDYFEFGCHRARTFRMALVEARYQALSNMRFHAFDSFEGLPPTSASSDVGERWSAGNLCTTSEEFLSLVLPYCDSSEKVNIHKGFYDSSLNDALSTGFRLQKVKIAFLCVDCDFFDSAVPVLKFCEQFLQEGSVIYIDDFFAGYRGVPSKGVQAAFRDFQLMSRWKFQEYLSVGAFGRSYLTYR